MRLLESVSTILGVHRSNTGLFHRQADLFGAAVRALISAIDAKDNYTHGHSERVARVANLIGALIFLDKEDSDKWISRYRRLSEEVDGICARWVGQDSAVESRVLMHSFAQLFDWCDVLLLSVPLPGTVAQTALREHLFRQVIQTRLFNRSELVTTEALRAINLAIIRAVDRVHVRRALLALPPPSMGESRRGWKSLVIMVGEVAVRSRDHLVASDPLFTEVARFFAGCLLRRMP